MLVFRSRAPALQSNSNFGNAVQDIIDGVKFRKNRFSYQVITRLADAIAAEIDHGATPIPSNWEFPWGSRTELDCFFGGLLARCIYHMLSVHFGEGKYKASASDQMCLSMERRMLVGDHLRITELSNNLVERIVTALTLGEGTKNPDPPCNRSFQSDLLSSPCRRY